MEIDVVTTLRRDIRLLERAIDAELTFGNTDRADCLAAELDQLRASWLAVREREQL